MNRHDTWYGTMEISPAGALEAGSYNTLRLTYTVGRYGMDNGGRIRLLFRSASDGGTPQTSNPAGDNYVTAVASNPDVSFKIDYLPKGGRRPWQPALVFEIMNESLAEGDQVYITFGDPAAGSKGYVAQSFVESDYRWLTEVECFETGTWVELETSPITPIVPSTPHRLVGLAPSEGILGNPFALTLKCEDSFGNPTLHYRGTVSVSLERVDGNKIEQLPSTHGTIWEGQAHHMFVESDGGLYRCKELVFKEPGNYRFRLQDESGLAAEACSNPFVIREKPQIRRHYWGDLHVQFNNGIGTGSVAEGFAYARDAAAIDFVGHQPNDFQFRQEGWDEVRQAAKQFHVPGEFLPFIGYEWSGNTPAGGDRNVHFMGDDGSLHRTSHWHVPDKSDEASDRYPLDELYKEFRGRDDVLIVPHIGGRRCDITRYYDPQLEPVLEICSVHGRFEWLLHEALELGLKAGVVGGSDDHTCRPGASYPTSHTLSTRGGLCGIYARELTREAIFEALRLRHTYATTGERIWLHVSTGDGYLMGSEWQGPSAPTIRVQAAGTRPIERVEIMRNLELAYSHPLFGPNDYRLTRVRLEWGGARIKGRGRHTDWSGCAEVIGGKIISATPFAFDHPKQGITRQDETSVHWHSTTSGDHDGIILDLEGGPDTAIEFKTGVAEERFTLQRISEQEIVKDCGGVEQYCRFSKQPVVHGPLSVDFEWQDQEAHAGCNAYWVRLVQEDGEIAWSSPMYFTME